MAAGRLSVALVNRSLSETYGKISMRSECDTATSRDHNGDREVRLKRHRAIHPQEMPSAGTQHDEQTCVEQTS